MPLVRWGNPSSEATTTMREEAPAGGNAARNGRANGDRNNATPAAWKDLPRRLLTVALGVPSIILLLRHPTTSWLFFQGAHWLCLIEWRTLLPPDKTTEDAVANKINGLNGDHDIAKSTPKEKMSLAFLYKIFGDETANSSPLLRCMFYLFCLFSLLVTISPTSFLPLELITYAIAVRLLPHLPAFQYSHATTMEKITAMQHYQFGMLYVSIGFHFILRISQLGGPSHVGNLLFIVWMSDTGALVLGRSTTKRSNNADKEGNKSDLNRTRPGAFVSFLKSISPGKTLPGILGAIITGPISALVYPITLSSTTVSILGDQCPVTLRLLSQFCHPLSQKMLLGLLLSLAGIVGDLAESSTKRMSKKKDSGGLLPGHGGVVDRFDSLLVAGIAYHFFVFGLG